MLFSVYRTTIIVPKHLKNIYINTVYIFSAWNLFVSTFTLTAMRITCFKYGFYWGIWKYSFNNNLCLICFFYKKMWSKLNVLFSFIKIVQNLSEISSKYAKYFSLEKFNCWSQYISYFTEKSIFSVCQGFCRSF